MARKFFTDIDMQSVSKITNLPAATADGDAVRFSQLNAAIEGLAWKDSCRVATQANLDLASPGATIDGVTMASSDRVLVRAQTAGAESGIYIWNGASTAMTRSLDASTFDELEQAVTSVEEGTSVGTTYRQTAVNGTLGSTTITWAVFGTSAPAASETTSGTAELATQAETDAGTDDARIVTPLKLKTWSSAPKRYAASFGDGSATSYTITHNLASRDLTVAIYRNSGSYDEIECDVEHTTTNTVTLVFATAPTSNQFRIVVLG
jgi:hypothetical protein